MSLDFYRAFEDKFRGSRELIKSRLRVYLPFIEPLKEIYPNAQVVDLGCGRGEWLELLDNNGFSVEGVDLDDGMLAECRDLGLRVRTGDALSFLKSIPDGCMAVVSGFHLAEHISFDDLQALVKESLRVLSPAGILILETPNPENIVVGTSLFYLDPTHQRPIPPELLAFLPEYYGFEKVKILRLQEPAGLATKENLTLLDVLEGVSPDYSVVAQKSAESELLDLASKPFGAEYGIALEGLAMTYSQQIERTTAHMKNDSDLLKVQLNERSTMLAAMELELSDKQARNECLKNELDSAKARLEELAGNAYIAKNESGAAKAKLNERSTVLAAMELELTDEQARNECLQTELHAAKAKLNERSTVLAAMELELTDEQSRIEWLHNEWHASQAKVDELNHSSHHWWLEADRLNKELQIVYNSKSWRVTWPLRAIKSMSRWLIMLPFRLLKWFLRPLAVSIISQILRRPVWVTRLRGAKTRFPGLYAKARSIARVRGLVGGAVAGSIDSEIQKDALNVSSIGGASNLKGPLDSLSSSAKAIYLGLKDLQLSSKNGEIK